jgi:PhoH-like ATPase
LLEVRKKAKIYVLDTNDLLQNPFCCFKLSDINLAIPIETLEELDAIKMEKTSERGRDARRVYRMLRELLPDSRAMLEGAVLDSGGT